jgi:hypothetical protein
VKINDSINYFFERENKSPASNTMQLKARVVVPSWMENHLSKATWILFTTMAFKTLTRIYHSTCLVVSETALFGRVFIVSSIFIFRKPF